MCPGGPERGTAPAIMGMGTCGHGAPMRELVMFALFAAMFLSVPIVVTLTVTFVIWMREGARPVSVVQGR
ncbi:hypothetical protein GCM10010317_029430 [Streptomyces mirabilis]|nr:hypothetical protein GCM10010317_029430 [Streptomyces mirabilis]